MNMKLKLKHITIDYDTNYGIDKRTGWSIAVDGSYILQFERFLLIALLKAIRLSF